MEDDWSKYPLVANGYGQEADVEGLWAICAGTFGGLIAAVLGAIFPAGMLAGTLIVALVFNAVWAVFGVNRIGYAIGTFCGAGSGATMLWLGSVLF